MEYSYEDIIKRKKELENQQEELLNQKKFNDSYLEKYSLYDTKSLVVIICKLLSVYENQSFDYEKILLLDESGHVKAKGYNIYSKDKSISLKLPYIKKYNPALKKVSKSTDISNISSLMANLSIPSSKNAKDFAYLEQFFIDLFNYRLKNNLSILTKEELKNYFGNYIASKKEEIAKRNQIYQEKAKEKHQKYKDEKLQSKYQIEYLPLIDAVCEILNVFYPEDFYPKYHFIYEESTSLNNQKLILIRRQLQIYANTKKIYSIDTTSLSKVTDEHDNTYKNGILKSKELTDNIIKFNDIKELLLPLSDNYPEVAEFIQLVNDKYLEGIKIIDEDDLVEILKSYINICNLRIHK